MSKKGQIPAQIFVYVIALIIFSLILLYGYNAIRGFKEKSDQISYIRFRTDLISIIERVSPDYGTIKREDLFLGGKYKEVCFVQNYGLEDPYTRTFVGSMIQLRHNITYDSFFTEINSFDEKVKTNVFLFANTLQETFEIGKINVTNGYLCVPIVNGRARIEFEGGGDHTLISSW